MRSFTRCLPVRRAAPGALIPCIARRTPRFSSRGLATGTVADPVASGLPASTDLLEVYRGMVATGRLRWDDNQIRLIMKLRDLLDSLEDYTPPVELASRLAPSSPLSLNSQSNRGSKWWKGTAAGDSTNAASRELIKVLTAEEDLASLTTPKGILVTGPPGTGKSMLLSLFYNALPTMKKRRVHYHAFTLALYRQVFKEMQRRRDEVTEDRREENREAAAAKGWRVVFAGGRWDTEGGNEKRIWKRDDTIPFVIARDMMLEYHILYFDELQLVDASSAALLRDVLSWYWRLGGIIISCSNRVPDDLIIGSQRERMASFLDALQSRCDVVELDGGRDWRRGVDLDNPAQRAPSWYRLNDSRFDELWLAFGGANAASRTLTVYSRPLPVPSTVGRSCRFTFEDLFETHLGPADYLTLASTFDTFFIDEVPSLSLKKKNEARRMISFVDAAYESRCQIFIRAAAPLEELFFPDAEASQGDTDQILAEGLTETLISPARPNVSVYNYTPTPAPDAPEASNGKGAFNALSVLGEDERFSFKRAVSRLIEMTTSPSYPDEEWLPLAPEARTWESAASRSKAASVRSTATSTLAEGDFAAEAAYSRPQRLTDNPIPELRDPVITHRNRGAGPRHDPPQIKPEHVWGVADEWGDKAGKWGKGPRAFKPDKEED